MIKPSVRKELEGRNPAKIAALKKEYGIKDRPEPKPIMIDMKESTPKQKKFGRFRKTPEIVKGPEESD